MKWPAPLSPKNGKRSRYPKQDTCYIDVHHGFPVVDCKLVEGSDGHGTGIAEQNIELTEALLGKAYEMKTIPGWLRSSSTSRVLGAA